MQTLLKLDLNKRKNHRFFFDKFVSYTNLRDIERGNTVWKEVQP